MLIELMFYNLGPRSSPQINKRKAMVRTNTIKSHIPPSTPKEREAHTQIGKPSQQTRTVVRNPERDISFPIFTRKEIETKRIRKEIKTII